MICPGVKEQTGMLRTEPLQTNPRNKRPHTENQPPLSGMTCQTMDKLGGNTDTEKSLPHLAVSHQLYQPPKAPTTPLLDQPSKAQTAHPPAISLQSHRTSSQLPRQHFNDPHPDPHTKPKATPRDYQPNSLRSTTAQHPARDAPLTLQTNRARLANSRPSVVGSSPIKPKPKRPSPSLVYQLKSSTRHHQPDFHRSSAVQHLAHDTPRAFRINPP